MLDSEDSEATISVSLLRSSISIVSDVTASTSIIPRIPEDLYTGGADTSERGRVDGTSRGRVYDTSGRG